jgi:hypothetical protein
MIGCDRLTARLLVGTLSVLGTEARRTLHIFDVLNNVINIMNERIFKH